MNSRNLIFAVCLALSLSTWGQTPGFYRDIFVDGGAHLTSMANFPPAEALGLEVEYLFTDASTVQNAAMVGDAMDSNGHLLYPDGEPRFRLLYTNGGKATAHGGSLYSTGRDRVRTYYANGGSYMVSCAGAFIASVSYEPQDTIPEYYHIWPGRTAGTGLFDTYTDHSIPAESPLLNYNDFGGDYVIRNVRHNGGGYAREDIDWPEETEILLRYNIGHKPDVHGKVSTWAYKPDEKRGRIVVTGSHPEFVREGERFYLTDAMMRYALDGVGDPHVKADLVNGETRVMDKYWEDEDPAYTSIGDRQYHHFTLAVPPNAKRLTVELHAEDGYDFNLYLNPASFAFVHSASYLSTDEKSDHVLDISSNEIGLWSNWFIGVECATTISAAETNYWGQTEVLNGISYTITATWDSIAVVGIAEAGSQPSGYDLHQNFPNPFNPSTTIRYNIPECSDVNLSIYDAKGRVVLAHNEFQNHAGEYEFTWYGEGEQGLGVPTGVYFARLEAGGFSQTIKMLLLK